MLNAARNVYDSIKSSWNAGGSTQDELQLMLYAAVEEEYETGKVKKGLLAKVGADANYDEKLTKAAYVKARVDTLLTKKGEILDLLAEIDQVESKINRLKKNIQNFPPQIEEKKQKPSQQHMAIAQAKGRERLLFLEDQIRTKESGYLAVFLISIVGGIGATVLTYLMGVPLPSVVAILAISCGLAVWSRRKGYELVKQSTEDLKPEIMYWKSEQGLYEEAVKILRGQMQMQADTLLEIKNELTALKTKQKVLETSLQEILT